MDEETQRRQRYREDWIKDGFLQVAFLRQPQGE